MLIKLKPLRSLEVKTARLIQNNDALLKYDISLWNVI